MSRHESPEVGAAAKRFVKALIRRAAEGDTEALEQLRMLEEYVPLAVGEAIRKMHDGPADYSWAELARVTGTSRQACEQRARRAVEG